MKKTVFLSSITILLFLLCVEVSAQSTFSADLEIRPRFELRNGFKSPIQNDQDFAGFTEQRSRLYLNYSSGNLSTNLTLQDVRIWGNHNQIYKEDPALTNLYEAWALYRFSPEWGIKLGRQALDYDNARFFGNLDWAQQGRSHDAILFQFRPEGGSFSLDLGGTFNQSDIFEPSHLTSTTYTLAGNNKSMQFLWMQKKWDNAQLSALFHNDGRQAGAGTDTQWRQTAGLTGTLSLNDFTFSAEAYYQFGKDIMEVDVDAHLLSLSAMFKPSSTSYTVGIDYLSGTGLNDTKNKSFDPLYGTNHKFYGHMDYFYVGSNHRQPGQGYNTGLINTYQMVTTPLSDKVNLTLHLHQFLSPVDIFDANGDKMSAYLGTEADLILSWAPQRDVTFLFGYSQIFVTETMNRIKNSLDAKDLQQWAWVMVRIRPNLFKL